MTSLRDEAVAESASDARTPQSEYRRQLFAAGVLFATGVDGVYARSDVFESIVSGLGALITRLGADQQARVLVLPPVFPRTTFEKTDYLSSFPNLMGSVHSFTGTEREAAALPALQEAGEPWGERLDQSELMLISAACHPIYPMYTGTLPEHGERADVYAFCFRHEPAVDPTRMQSFRQREYVYLGTPDAAYAHRQTWIARAMDALGSLGLPVRQVVANDPFFGRSGRMLASNQRDEELKFEVVVDLYDGADSGTAIASSNCHLDHFGTNFAIRTADGEVAHSACVGFGMERITLALLRNHGFDPTAWPPAVRAWLWP